MAFQSKLGTAASTLIGSTMAAGMGINDPLIQEITQELGLTHVTGKFGVAQNTLNMSHSAIFFQAVGETQNVVHTLTMNQEVSPGTFQDLSQDLAMSDVADVVLFGPVLENLWMADAATFSGPIPEIVSDTLVLVHTVEGRFDVPVSVSQDLGITHQIADIQKHDLGLTHLAMAYLNASPNFFDVLGITDSVQISMSYVVQPTDTNIIADAVTYFIDDGGGCLKNQYNQYGTLPELPFTVESGAVLSFTSITGEEDLVFMKNPELDDRDRLGETRINRESRGGELQVFRDPTWPTVNTLQGTVIGLKLTDVNAFFDFLSDHLGEEISLNDWHGRSWRGVIINPGEPAVEDTKNRWTISFEFEGVEMPGPDLFQRAGIVDLMTYNIDYTRSLTDAMSIGHTVDPGLANVLHNGFNVTHDGFEVFHG